ncbi:CoB--CoM heterodisulfide reductase iron-sulfur subunit A family protein [Varunaivibrio sulfuroxidans]|uniref:Putative adenylylsulfate reductase-associated electron transfer protein QmoA n=1 Tax=Varunaivibrio sulfuroxidans TaxID=1773489 RepID=A0A4R3J3A9_9PROT|nr:CoB--CoM heterodisulfide reductase iron-sulfur subunit A family protein [Varunaivibrio sulfuroxidans]TCS60308.1 putative adenylylsulfate reductase-associated electron transfer protein QmoA [Varunaivibrio sulfuroxidans]WES31005.1 CoB--CoM heterodisulfide reductase iron-sulfur subunit A family protein [Varunaivibrio sulfuroxidans]
MSNGSVNSQTILVVGGGIAGVSAAVEAAESGYEVVLLENAPTLGGRVAKLNRYFPKLCHPTCGLEINFQRIKKLKNLKIFTMSSVAQVAGEKGNFTVSVKTTPRYVKANCTACGACAQAAESDVANAFNYNLDTVKAAYLPHEMAFPMRYVIDPSVIGTPEADKIKAACSYDAVDLDEVESTFDINVGAIIWATGWRPYDPAKITPYSYGESPDIITNVEMERLAAHDGPTHGKILRPSNGEAPKKVALIQCAGSRDYNHLPYCSRICCLGSLKHAAYIREQYAESEVDIYYIDIRAHDKLESFHVKLKADPQVSFRKSKPASIEVGDDGGPIVKGEDTITREVYARPYDLVVLATGMEPSNAQDRAPVTIEQDEYGFMVPHQGDKDGMISAGVASGPLDVSMSVQSATAAALKAIQAVSSNA